MESAVNSSWQIRSIAKEPLLIPVAGRANSGPLSINLDKTKSFEHCRNLADLISRFKLFNESISSKRDDWAFILFTSGWPHKRSSLYASWLFSPALKRTYSIRADYLVMKKDPQGCITTGVSSRKASYFRAESLAISSPAVRPDAVRSP